MLLVIREDGRRLWVRCGGFSCRRWIRVDITRGGGVSTEVLPENYHLDLDSIPVLERVRRPRAD